MAKTVIKNFVFGLAITYLKALYKDLSIFKLKADKDKKTTECVH